jgi:hypothetical protein
MVIYLNPGEEAKTLIASSKRDLVGLYQIGLVRRD